MSQEKGTKKRLNKEFTDRTSNGLERVHCFVIELEHHIFGLE